MFAVTTEAWTLALAACLGLLLSSTTLALAVQSSVVRSRAGACISFIRDLTISRTDESIVRAIVSLARSVGLKVVAEGIESAEQLELVTRLECDQWQGYHCCTPQPAVRFAAMLEDRNGTRTGIVAALAALVVRGDS